MKVMEAKAYRFAQKKHEKQLDDSGKNYFEAHIEQVVAILRCVTDDEDILAAAYLHDTLEDTDTLKEELIQEFGFKITNLVLEVTHDGDKRHGYYFPRLKSKDAILIKFADRLSNLSRMEPWSEDRRKDYLRVSKFWKENL